MRCSPTALGVERSAYVPGPKSGVHGLSCLVIEGIVRTKVVLLSRVFWPWFLRRVRPCPLLRGPQVLGKRWKGQRAPSQFVIVLFLFSGLLFRSVACPLGWLVFGGSRCVGFGLCCSSSAFLGPSLVLVAARVGFLVPRGLRLSSWSLSLSLASFSPSLVCWPFCGIFRVAGCPPGGKICGVQSRTFAASSFHLEGIRGVSIALRSSRSRRLLR